MTALQGKGGGFTLITKTACHYLIAKAQALDGIGKGAGLQKAQQF